MKNEDVKKFIEKVNTERRDNPLDLSADEDLSIAIMNLISIEEHFFFTAMKTEKLKYFDLLKETREIRKDLLKRIVKDYEGEVWCISKHLLSASMRLMEVGTKELGRGNKKSAYDLFTKSYDLYALFWGINLGKVNIGKVRGLDEKKIDKKDERGGVFAKLRSLVKHAIDCCIE